MQIVGPPIGCDYGVKPRMIVVGDAEFPNLLRQGLRALSYERLSQHGLLVNPPLLGFVFADEATARDCFSRFKGWADDSQDGDAVGISFIEFETDEYGLCVYPDGTHLVDRCIPPLLRPEVEPIIITVGHLKMFPRRSEAFRWFKRITTTSPTVVAPATIHGGVMLDLAVRKMSIPFYTEPDIPDNSTEAVLLRSRRGDGASERRSALPADARPSAREIAMRRRAQLSRFFPITLERLSFDGQFQQLRSGLVDEGYKTWQIDQAACNLILRWRQPELFAADDTSSPSAQSSSRLSALQHFLIGVEDISDTIPGPECLTARDLRAQVQADMADLLAYVTAPDTPDLPPNLLRDELGRRRLLDG
jgi:hypothetical protein